MVMLLTVVIAWGLGWQVKHTAMPALSDVFIPRH